MIDKFFQNREAAWAYYKGLEMGGAHPDRLRKPLCVVIDEDADLSYLEERDPDASADRVLCWVVPLVEE